LFWKVLSETYRHNINNNSTIGYYEVIVVKNMADWKAQLKQLTPKQAVLAEKYELTEKLKKDGPAVAKQIIDALTRGERQVSLDSGLNEKVIEAIVEDMRNEWDIIIRLDTHINEANWALYFTPKAHNVCSTQ
jgi:hypothetical protein